ncbi:MAG: family 20 glycosylhydrolase [Saprospiraceae bacterium]|jgi:lysophospholipase L1-like esterase|nr:family 20 glycosylhydrolase [Saprospiraceae bacterium]
MIQYKTFRHILLLLVISSVVRAQVNLPSYSDSIFSTYYHQRVSLFNTFQPTKDEIIFLGNSITDGAEWSELFNDLKIKNRGISGDITAGVLYRLNEVVVRKPSKIFLLIGTNDLARGISTDSLVTNMLLIADYIKQESPTTQFYVQSILPVNKLFGKFSGHTKNDEQIRLINKQLKENSFAKGYTYIDLYSSFSDDEGNLKEKFTNDGLHLKGEAYLMWKHIVFPYIYDLQQKPSLIPLPRQLKWTEKDFALFNCKTILISDSTLLKDAILLKNELKSKGLRVSIKKMEHEAGNYIYLKLGSVPSPQLAVEAYAMEVNDTSIIITANTSHGIFNGIQTLVQLMRDDVYVNGCAITDWPAFSWRGYMIDVGRNYMSMDLLKQQIDMMGHYKLNVFHFHATEDIAWRLASKRYPQLTAPEHMLRNKGMYYNETDMKELIAYCQERYIEFVPEIDMPGHSAAFKRAMKTDMQSDSGTVIVKNIIKEFLQTYDVNYLHIGADEVKISNKNFIPEVTTYIESFGKKVIGWQPGGNFAQHTIRQLWMDDNGHLSEDSDIQFIDSRHLYLNHMDPLEAVVTIFNRRIGDKEKEDKNMKGGTICMWPDRRVENETDVLRMNPVYPGMLSFAERSWRGGGHQGWVANISEPNTPAAIEFADFEERLLDNKKLFFSTFIFQYAKQSNVIWSLLGPYENGGDLSKIFEPEQENFNEVKTEPVKEVVGGTIVLRHWWAPLIKGGIDEPKENTTWYATTKIWSDEEGQKSFWIGFNNFSRSPATDSPPLGTWDNKGSSVWVNGKLIDPPHWQYGGQRGNSETPLMDEGYEYRSPSKVYMKIGWNTVLIKAPVGSFKGKDWQNPVKWMFTFVPVK